MATMCFDIRRCDDNHVCIYRADSNHFSYNCHHPQSSWHADTWDGKNSWLYVVIAKDKYYEGIEVIRYCGTDKAHCEEILKDCNDSESFMWDSNCYDHRMISIPLKTLVRNRRFKDSDGKVWTYPITKITVLGDAFKLYCPFNLNKKHRVYGDWGSRKKNGKGCYFSQPRRLRGTTRG